MHNPIWNQIIIYAVLISVPLLLIGVPIFLLTGGLQKFGLKALQKRYSGLNLNSSPQHGDVQVVYHTYRGFLIWWIEDEHRVYAPAHDARILLGRLLRYNLTWGMLSYGFAFIPLLALGNYLMQSYSISKQQRDLSPAVEWRLPFSVNHMRQASARNYLVKYDASISVTPDDLRVTIHVLGTNPRNANPALVQKAVDAIRRGAESVLHPRGLGAIVQIWGLRIHEVDFDPKEFELQTAEDLSRALDPKPESPDIPAARSP